MWDPAVREAFEVKAGHGVESEPGRLLGLDVLTINHARSLHGISACRNLMILVLAGCELANLDELSQLTSLGLLSVSDSVIGGIEAIGELDVHTVHIERSGLADISPLLRCSGLIEVRLSGTALSDDAFDRVIPDLKGMGCDVVFPDDVERELTSLLRQTGLSVNCYKRGNAYRLCRPGLSLTDRPEVNHPEVSPVELRATLMSDPGKVATLFERSL
ncbi:hypothetical protein [Streptomyces sp. SID2888]|uniref:hypothetical protein n=1 Tax=Streptomyces sp. SID2888 TaxID=2690256 RepID=UPI0013697ABD|nr:hypothetical protein [Streptomyces sp. SID2888]MYV48038.1 hypothetical protein [Streptomyces sp. SID2888]